MQPRPHIVDFCLQTYFSGYWLINVAGDDTWAWTAFTRRITGYVTIHYFVLCRLTNDTMGKVRSRKFRVHEAPVKLSNLPGNPSGTEDLISLSGQVSNIYCMQLVTFKCNLKVKMANRHKFRDHNKRISNQRFKTMSTVSIQMQGFFSLTFVFDGAIVLLLNWWHSIILML